MFYLVLPSFFSKFKLTLPKFYLYIYLVFFQLHLVYLVLPSFT